MILKKKLSVSEINLVLFIITLNRDRSNAGGGNGCAGCLHVGH